MNFLSFDTHPWLIHEILALRANYCKGVKVCDLQNSFSEGLETNGRGGRKRRRSNQGEKLASAMSW